MLSPTQAPAVDPLVSIRRLVKSFGPTRAVDELSLDLEAGRFVTLLGPSGCGKTTLLRLIGALEQPDSGEIRIAGRPVASYGAVDRPTRMVFQSYALFPHMTVAQNIAYGLKLRRLPSEAIRAAVQAQLATVGLAEHAGKRPSQLSGGQQQRVALARALITRPQVLLLDEPLAALDLKLRQRLQAELKALQRAAGITFVFVTHDQQEALALSDEVVVMERGRIVQRAAPAALYDRPATRYVAEFVGEATVLPASRIAADRITTPIGDLPAAPRPDLAASAIAAVIRPEGVRLAASGQFPIEGVVTETTYRGADLLVDLAIGAQRLRASVTGPERAAIVAGQPVSLAVAPDAVWLIPDGPTSTETPA